MPKLILICLLLIASNHVYAKFYVWYEADGSKHISSVPKECITPEKTLHWNCSSFITKGDPEMVATIKTRQAAAAEVSSMKMSEKLPEDCSKIKVKMKGHKVNSTAGAVLNLGLAISAKDKAIADCEKQKAIAAGTYVPPSKELKALRSIKNKLNAMQNTQDTRHLLNNINR